MAAAKGDPVVPLIELECPVVGCALGEEGGKYKKPAEVYILQMEQVYFPIFFFRSHHNGNLKNLNS